MPNWIYAGTHNVNYRINSALYRFSQLEAAGFQWPAPRFGSPKALFADLAHANAPDAAGMLEAWMASNPRFNGGVTMPRDTRYQKGDYLYRFSDSSASQRRSVSGKWWFDYDSYLYLRGQSYGDFSRFRDYARAGFCVLDEYGDMGNLVRAKLIVDLWAIIGSSAPARGARSERGRDSIVNWFGSNLFQIYIPGAAEVNQQAMEVAGWRSESGAGGGQS
jgi:hypothetical protein